MGNLPKGITRKQKILHAIATGDTSDLPEGITRKEKILHAIASGDTSNIPEGITREEQILQYIAENGGGDGGESAEVLKKLIERTVTNYAIPDGITKIGNAAFYRCANLENVTIPNSVIEIGDSAFEYTNISSIDIPPNVKKIGRYCFAHNINANVLKSITFHEGLETICSGAFRYHGCENITLPSSVKTIEDAAFEDGKLLKTFTIPEDIGITIIPGFMLANCPLLENVTIPEGIIEIGNGAFQGDWDEGNKITSVVLPSTLELLLNNAFSYCTNLETVTFKGTPTQRIESAFQNSPSLKTINVPWAEGEVENAPWGARNATINYNYVE